MAELESLGNRAPAILLLILVMLSPAQSISRADANGNYRWICASDLDGNAPIILERYNERILVAWDHYVARALFVMEMPYRRFKDEFREVVDQRFGVRFYREHEQSDYADNWYEKQKSYSDAVDFRLGKERLKRQRLRASEQLGPLGIHFRHARKTEIITASYNRVSNRDGRSQTSFEIYDGSLILGKPSVILMVSRHDSAKEWGIHNAHNPFSFGFKHVERDYVSSTEFNFVVGILERKREPFLMLPIPGLRPLFSYIEAWRTVHDWLNSGNTSSQNSDVKLSGCQSGQ